MELAMSLLSPGDLVLGPALASYVEDEAGLSSHPERRQEQVISRKTGKPIGLVRLEMEARHAAKRDKEAGERRRCHDPAVGMLPVPEREQHGQQVGEEEIILEPAETRPVYCDESHQVEQRVVKPAVTQRVRRIVSTVEQMRRRQTISDATAAHAEAWHATWALAEAGFRSCLAGGVGRDPGGLPEAVVIAASDLRAAQMAVGKMGHRVLTELIGHEMSIQQMAERHRMHRQEMTGICKAVLERLTEHYEA